MSKILFPGTFDPFTNAHFDVLKRVHELGYTIEIGILENPSKKCMFSSGERKEMIANLIKTQKLDNINIFFSDELLSDICKKKKINNVVRGLRNVRDYEYETDMEYNNKKLNENLEYIYINSAVENIYVSSTAVRELLRHNANISHLVPEEINTFIKEKNAKSSRS